MLCPTGFKCSKVQSVICMISNSTSVAEGMEEGEFSEVRGGMEECEICHWYAALEKDYEDVSSLLRDMSTEFYK
ncbi:hypothetical protein C5167_037149, partial [Papaver somniferum]